MSVTTPRQTRDVVRRDLLLALRGDRSKRSVVDPGLAGGLRAWLEDGVCALGACIPDGGRPIVIDKRSLAMCAHDPGDPDRGGHGSPTPTVAMACGALIETLFRQLITTGRIQEPFAEARAALACQRRYRRISAFIDSLGDRQRRDLATEVERQAGILVRLWPPIPPRWFPRTQERLCVPLCGGRVLLVGIVDLMVGVPMSDRASVGLVEVKSGERHHSHRTDLSFYALLETIRSGAPPSRLATFYARTGEMDSEDVTECSLTSMVERVIQAALGLARAGHRRVRGPGMEPPERRALVGSST